MTFPLTGPFVDVHAEITPTIATNWGLWLSRAVDGTAGGTWAGPNVWTDQQEFQGVAIFNGASVTLGGVGTSVYAPVPIIIQSTTGGIAYRAPHNTLGNANADVTVEYDVWRMTTAPTGGDKTYTLRHTGASIPVVGQRVVIVFADTDLGAPSDALVKREDGTLLATFDGSDGLVGWAEFQYTSGGWILIKWGGAVDCTPAGGAPMP